MVYRGIQHSCFVLCVQRRFYGAWQNFKLIPCRTLVEMATWVPLKYHIGNYLTLFCTETVTQNFTQFDNIKDFCLSPWTILVAMAAVWISLKNVFFIYKSMVFEISLWLLQYSTIMTTFYYSICIEFSQVSALGPQ